MNNLYNNLKHEHLFNNPTILDIGANIGLEAKKIYDTFTANGVKDINVILVEPAVENVLGIYENITKWNLQNNFFVENCAIDLTNGYKTFGYENSKGMQGRINGSLDEFNWKEWKYTGTRVVRTKTLDNICQRPNIVKIDIERYEYVVFYDICKNSNIQVIYLELHGPCYPLNIYDFIQSCIQGTNLELTGFYQCNQSQTDSLDSYEEIGIVETINCSDYRYAILERKEMY